MSGLIYKAASGALLQQARLNVLSHNLANINTIGFKADKIEFRVPQDEQERTAANPASQVTPYTPPATFAVNYSAGQMLRTGNPLDVALTGSGFFEIETQEGLEYTRSGNFTLDSQGVLTSGDGFPVMGQAGPITLDGAVIEIGDNGDIFVDGALVDRIKVVDFAKPYDLSKVGPTRFAPTKPDVRIQDAEGTMVNQGVVENSNVNAVATMTELIETTRVFEAYQRVIRASDEATAKTINDVGRSI
ncbi:MAG: flagellar hook-basal body protein [Desulfobacteraceae bacterium]|nr:flagellar hook-basal body protein [Desulfobacteraceae bacterium]